MSNGDEQEMELKDVGKLWSAVHRIEVALTGIDGKNGLRGELRAFQESTQDHLTDQDSKLEGMARWKDAVEARFDSYLKHERAATCVGKSALDDYLARLEHDQEEALTRRRQSDTLVIELKKQRLALFAAVLVALISTIGGIATAVISSRSNQNLIDSSTITGAQP